nr:MULTISPECIES: M48 family metallopeptidase [unclassified Acidovorax]
MIDYVIVHELAHLLESNHTPDFWNIVRAKVPGVQFDSFIESRLA